MNGGWAHDRTNWPAHRQANGYSYPIEYIAGLAEDGMVVFLDAEGRRQLEAFVQKRREQT